MPMQACGLAGSPGSGGCPVVCAAPRQPTDAGCRALSCAPWRVSQLTRAAGRQVVVITDPFLLQEFFAAERAGAFEKPAASARFTDKVRARAPTSTHPLTLMRLFSNAVRARLALPRPHRRSRRPAMSASPRGPDLADSTCSGSSTAPHAA